MKRITLTPRLNTVASFVERCDTVADIGTDHGFIPAYLIQNDLCKRAIASDINKGPLSSAVKTAQDYNISDKVKFICAPGLDGVAPGEADTVIIAGMGGETITEIIHNASWLKEQCVHLVLQPQSKFELLEEFLYNNGYEVLKAKLIYDSGRLYLVLSVLFTDNAVQKCTSFFADKLINDPLLKDYIQVHLKKLKLRENGLMSSENVDKEEVDGIRNLADHLRSFITEV